MGGETVMILFVLFFCHGLQELISLCFKAMDVPDVDCVFCESTFQDCHSGVGPHTQVYDLCHVWSIQFGAGYGFLCCCGIGCDCDR